MDQSAFRNILTSGPSKTPATGRAAGVLGGQTLKRGYASGNRASNFAPKEQTDKGESSTPVLAPRKVKKKDGKYKDRAEMRRLGLEDEFKPIERMVDDFEERAKAEGVDDEAIAAKRAYLGGDAEHSALFKGLDYSLLEVRKAELAVEEGTKLDDELDKVLEHALPSEEATPEAGPGPSTSGQKRTREEIMQALQTSRKRLAQDGDETEKKNKKPKGDDTIEKVAAPPALSSRFKKIASTPAETDGKKRKKKKKVLEVAAAPAPSALPPPGLMIISAKADIPESPAVLLERENRIKAESLRRRSVTPPVATHSRDLTSLTEPRLLSNDPSPPALSAMPAPATLPKPVAAPTPVLDSDEEDIFGGVSDYEMNLGSDSDEEGVKSVKPKTAPDAPDLTTKKGKGWFGDEEEEEQAEQTRPSDSMLPSILRSTKAIEDGAQRIQRMVSRSPSPEEGTLLPLQPLASSRIPSAKELLAMDKVAVENEKRREKKVKWRAKQGLTVQEGAGEDDERGGDREKTEKERERAEQNKLHVEQQRLEAYMNKKKQA